MVNCANCCWKVKMKPKQSIRCSGARPLGTWEDLFRCNHRAESKLDWGEGWGGGDRGSQYRHIFWETWLWIRRTEQLAVTGGHRGCLFFCSSPFFLKIEEIQSVAVFSLWWWFPLLCKSFFVYLVKLNKILFIFSFCFPCPRRYIRKKYCHEKCPNYSRYYCLCSLLKFLWFWVLKFLIHSEFILLYGIRWWSRGRDYAKKRKTPIQQCE